jgi:hypothetical protein
MQVVNKSNIQSETLSIVTHTRDRMVRLLLLIVCYDNLRPLFEDTKVLNLFSLS